MSNCNSPALFTTFVMQRLPTILPNTVIIPPVTQVASEFQSYYNSLTLEPQDVLLFACQIVSGMVRNNAPQKGILGYRFLPPLQEFLASLNVLHRDLACRNILMAHDKVLKLADFGLSRELENVYISKSFSSLPVRWMAPEAVAWKVYAEKSDV